MRGRFVKGKPPLPHKSNCLCFRCCKETLDKIHQLRIGKPSWNKGTKGLTKSNFTSFKKGSIPWNKGLKTGIIPKSAFKIGNHAKSGKDHPFWKGGVTPEYKKIRKSKEYKEWRKLIFERDGFTCQKCKKIGGELQVDHIKPFAYFPKLRFDIKNGRTLCVKCHRQTKTWGINQWYNDLTVL